MVNLNMKRSKIIIYSLAIASLVAENTSYIVKLSIKHVVRWNN